MSTHGEVTYTPYAEEKVEEANFDKKSVRSVEEVLADDGASSIDTITALVIEDHSHDISLRTMSWQKTAWLLCGDQVCLAVMAQTWSLS